MDASILPDVSQQRGFMKRARFIPGALLLAAAVIIMLTESLPYWISFILLFGAALCLIYGSRGAYYFSKGAKYVSMKDKESIAKASVLFRKALKAGLPENYALYAGTFFIQQDDAELGKNVLEPITARKDPKLSAPAMTSLSMYYYSKADYEKAISLCEKAKELGYKNHNLLIDLATYYLAAGKVKEFRLLCKELEAKADSSPAMLDFLAIDDILSGKFRSAGGYLQRLFEHHIPDFADPYVHSAEVYLHYGDIENALKKLNEGKDKRFTRFSIYSAEYIETMISALENPKERVPFTEAVNSSPLLIINGKLPQWDASETECNDMKLPGYPVMEGFEIEAYNEIPEEEGGEISTDLTEEDEEWLRKHQAEE